MPQKFHRTNILGNPTPDKAHTDKPVLFTDNNRLGPFQPVKLVAMQYQGILEMLVSLDARLKELENGD